MEDQDRSVTESPAAAPPVPTAPLWEDFLDIFYAPSSVFDRRRAGKWGMALLVFFLLFLAATFISTPLLQPYTEAEMQRTMSRIAAQMGNTEIEAEMSHTMATSAGSMWTIISQPILVSIGAMLIGLLLALASRLAGAGISAAQGVMIGVYSFFPRILQTLGTGLQALLLKSDGTPRMSDLSFGPLRFMATDDTSMQMASVLSRFDLFTIWVVVLQVIGIRMVARTTWGRAAAAAVGIWLLFTLVTFAMFLLAPRGM